MSGPDKTTDEIGLDALFAEARQAKPSPSDALLARIVADAAAEQSSPVRAAVRSRGMFRQLLDALGGWRTVGGLATAAAAGVYIGVAQPALIETAADVVEESEFISADLWPGDAMFFEEG